MDYASARIDEMSQKDGEKLTTNRRYGESSDLWELLKDRQKMSLGFDGKPDVHKWCTKIYQQFPDNLKTQSNRRAGRYLPYTSAARQKEPLAVLLSTLRRWLN